MDTTDTPAIRFSDVSRRFEKTNALRGFSATVPEGSITALLGRNAAGKTTAIRCALGLLALDGGCIEVLGADAADLPEAIRAQVGYVSERSTLDPLMSIAELCEFGKAAYPTWDDDYAIDLCERLEIPSVRRIGSMSLGQSRKVALMFNLAFRPRLLILDEPAGNLDAVVRREFLEAMLQSFTREGTTVLLSTHLLHDVDRVADRVVLIDAGRCRIESNLDDLRSRVKALRVLGEAASSDRFVGLPGLLSTKRFGSDLLLVVENYRPGLEQEVAARTATRIDAIDLPLEDIFIAYGSRSGRATSALTDESDGSES